MHLVSIGPLATSTASALAEFTLAGAGETAVVGEGCHSLGGVQIPVADGSMPSVTVQQDSANGLVSFTLTEVYVRFYLYFQSLPAVDTQVELSCLFQIGPGGDPKLTVLLNGDGTLTLTNAANEVLGTTDISITTGTFWRFELYSSTGEDAPYEFRLARGDHPASVMFSGTTNLGLDLFGAFSIGPYLNTPTGNCIFIVSDIAADDTDYPPVSYTTRLAPATLSGTWSGAIASIKDWPDASGTYISVATNGPTATVTFESLSVSTDQIICLKPFMAGLSDGMYIPSPTVQLRLIGTAGEYDSMTQSLTPIRKFGGLISENDPGTDIGWTESAVDAVQVSLVAGVARPHRVSNVSIGVEYVPAGETLEGEIRIGSEYTPAVLSNDLIVPAINFVTYEDAADAVRVGEYWLSVYTDGNGHFALGVVELDDLSDYSLTEDSSLIYAGQALKTITDGDNTALVAYHVNTDASEISGTPYGGAMLSVSEYGLLVKDVFGDIEEVSSVVFGSSRCLVAKVDSLWNLVVSKWTAG